MQSELKTYLSISEKREVIAIDTKRASSVRKPLDATLLE